MPELSKTIWIAAGAKLALHLFSSARGYGTFGDEFYYLACAAHPDTGYVDHPPFSIWVLAIWTQLAGNSLASNYSEAGAIDLLGPERGLPAAISPHNNYWLWGTGEADGSVMLLVGGRVELWREHWGSIEEAATWDCGHCLPRRNHGMVYIARSPRTPLSQIWQALRRYN